MAIEKPLEITGPPVKDNNQTEYIDVDFPTPPSHSSTFSLSNSKSKSKSKMPRVDQKKKKSYFNS